MFPDLDNSMDKRFYCSTGIVVVIEDEQESPLGPIRVTLNCEELDALTDWLAPEQ